MSKSVQESKSFAIPKRLVWEAYQRVAANKGAAGVDGCSIADFEADLQGNLYKIWNRMSSGSYFPPPVLAVEIPKPHGEGTRVLGVPTVADRVAQTVVALQLQARTESIFHDDSYGYRRQRSALDAVGVCRTRCQRKDWVIDLDVAQFFDSVDHDLLLKAVEANTDQRWVVLYVKRWLVAPLALPDGTLTERDRGTPQGSAVSPVLANLFLQPGKPRGEVPARQVLFRAASLRTTRASFDARGSPAIYAAFAAACPWMTSWQERQTTRVLRRLLAMSAAQAGWSVPGSPRLARFRIWWTTTLPGCSHSSHRLARSRVTSSLRG